MSTEPYTRHFEDGKYTVINNNGVLKALRYGEEWRDLTGDNLIGAMLSEIERLDAYTKEVEAKNERALELALDEHTRAEKLIYHIKQLRTSVVKCVVVLAGVTLSKSALTAALEHAKATLTELKAAEL
jgi:translation initiation factor 2B subunit (eIF-2B alpha/beta/delta family)